MVLKIWTTEELVTADQLNGNFVYKKDQFDTKFGISTTDGTINMPIGTIIPWLLNLTGTPTIPSGWRVCDGTNGTPDLNDDVYLRGTSGTTGTTGGANSHSHGLGTEHQGGVQTGAAAVSSGTDHQPTYYTVVFIIKVGV